MADRLPMGFDLDMIPVPREDTRPFGTRLWDFLAQGGPWGTAQPGQRGTFVPTKRDDPRDVPDVPARALGAFGGLLSYGAKNVDFPTIVAQPAESLHSLMTAPLSDLSRMRDPDITRTLAEQSFDVASMLPAAGVAAGRTMPTNAAGMGGGRLDPPKGITAYHGTQDAGMFGREGVDPSRMWMTASRADAGEYALRENNTSLIPGYEERPAVFPVVADFKNPMVVDAKGNSYLSIPYEGGRASSNLLATYAEKGNHDGLIINNVKDPPATADASYADPTTVLAAIKRGTVKSPLTGETLFSNPDDLNTSAVLAAMQGQERPKGITAYHGSPHDFDRFDMSKIGTGEGAQAYGHGLYFAEAEDVAKQYRDTLKDGHNVVRDPKGLALDNALMYGADPNSLALHRLRERGDFDAAIKQLQREADNTRSWKRDASKYDEAIAELERLKAEGYQVQANPGRMYEVRINADPNDFLDWDKPLSQQSEKVRALLEHPAVKRQTDFFGDPAGEKLTGKSAYGAVANWNTAGNQRAGSGDPTPLRDAGIPGIRYLDQGSRVAGEGSRNYVVFDDALVEILRKYANAPDPTTAAILALFAAQQQQGQQQQ